MLGDFIIPPGYIRFYIRITLMGVNYIYIFVHICILHNSRMDFKHRKDFLLEIRYHSAVEWGAF
jgi:hypothetical protein